MAKTKKSKVMEAADEVKEQLDAMCSIKCPVEDYLEALEEIQTHIEASIDAAKDDIRRNKEE
jgi:hypothetical protein